MKTAITTLTTIIVISLSVGIIIGYNYKSQNNIETITYDDYKRTTTNQLTHDTTTDVLRVFFQEQNNKRLCKNYIESGDIKVDCGTWVILGKLPKTAILTEGEK